MLKMIQIFLGTANDSIFLQEGTCSKFICEKKMIKIFWEKQSWKELILMEALPKLYLLHPTIQVLNAANSEHLKIKSFEKLAHSESETDDCGFNLIEKYVLHLYKIGGLLQGWTPRPAGNPVKMIKTAGKLGGKIKARISTFSNRGDK